MALSEAEREWLERREEYLRFYCRHCQFFKPYNTPHVNPGWCQGDCWCCPVAGKDIQYSFQDAAEFEARVAERLAERAFRLSDERDISGAVLYPARLDILPRLKSGEDVKMKGSAAWHGTS